MLTVLLVLAAPMQALAQPTPAHTPPAWAHTLQQGLDAVQARFPGQIGVYVEHLGRGESLALHADEPWYVASGVKVPVAIAVLQDVERGALSLDTRITLRAEDFVDGAGQTNAQPAGARLPVSWLLEQMIIDSDNTATDLLIGQVGLARVNAVAQDLLAGTQPLTITSLADVRRLAYATLHPAAAHLTAQDLLALRRAGAGRARYDALARILAVPPQAFHLPDLDSAFEAYYATNVNTAHLRDIGHMLTRLAQGTALGPWGTDHLLTLMTRVRTGERRLKAGLPADTQLAHKTGTQHRRICDLGIATTPVGDTRVQVVIAACARGASLSTSERALREVAAAITASGVLVRDNPMSFRLWGPR